MLFNSGIFVFIYLPITMIGYLLCLRLPWGRAGIAWLGLASLFFYGYWNPAFLPLLAISITVNYFAGRMLDRSIWQGPQAGRKALLIAAITANLTTLAYFKYANFLSSSIGSATGIAMPILDVVLPIGISFYTFTQIAYLADTYGSGRSERSVLAYILFVTYFPHLIAGPVLHHSEMMPQFLRDQKNRLNPDTTIKGLLFFACGLAKKVLIADSVAASANRGFQLAELNQLGFADSWFSALAYTVQIYFDFSGYSDMAVGLALLFAIQLPLNFDSPYKARSISDFWRCWHMTLSRFLRDYLYIPLGGNRHGPARRQINLMLTMLLGGLWHGAAWTFVVWGGLHGLYLQINHSWRHLVENSALLGGLVARHSRTVALLGWALTFLAVVVAWVFFRAETFTAAIHLLSGMFSGTASIQAGLLDTRVLVYIALGLLIAFVCPNSQQSVAALSQRYAGANNAWGSPWRQGMTIGTLLFAVVALTIISASRGTSEFIYFNF